MQRAGEMGGGALPKLVITGAVLSTILCLAFIPALLTVRNDYYMNQRFKLHGVRTKGIITDIHKGGCGEGGCHMYAEYAIYPRGRGKYTGQVDLGSQNEDDYLEAKRYHLLDVVYDSANPAMSHWNRNDIIFTRTLDDYLRGALTIVLGMLAAGLVVINGTLAIVYLSIKRRWE